MFNFSKRSKQRMAYLHPDLRAVVELALSKTSVDFSVLETKRTISRQKALLASGASTTMNSRHIIRKHEDHCHAVDLGAYVGGRVRWDWPYASVMTVLATFAPKVLQLIGVDISW